MILQHLSTIGLLEFFGIERTANVQIPLFGGSISAGFPSPADDYIELKIDLNRYLVKNPAATFYVRVKGDSMENAGIFEDDILVVDRALPPKDNDIAICVIAGEFTVKRIVKRKGRICLLAENTGYLPIEITEDTDFQIWGIVSYIIHKPQ